MKPLWAIVHYYSDGSGAPQILTVLDDELAANAFAAILGASYGSDLHVIETAMWPDVKPKE